MAIIGANIKIVPNGLVIVEIRGKIINRHTIPKAILPPMDIEVLGISVTNIAPLHFGQSFT